MCTYALIYVHLFINNCAFVQFLLCTCAAFSDLPLPNPSMTVSLLLLVPHSLDTATSSLPISRNILLNQAAGNVT